MNQTSICAGVSFENEVYQALKQKPMSCREIADFIGASITSVAESVKRLQDCKYIASAHKTGKVSCYATTDKPYTREIAEWRANRKPMRQSKELPEGFGSGGKIELEKHWSLR